MVNWDFSIAQQAINYPIYSTQNGPISSAVLKFVKNKQNKYAKDYIVRYPVLNSNNSFCKVVKE